MIFLEPVSPRCCTTSITQRGLKEGNKTSEFSSEVNRLNSNLPNEMNKTSELPCEANKLNSNFSNLPNEGNETRKLPA